MASALVYHQVEVGHPGMHGASSLFQQGTPSWAPGWQKSGTTCLKREQVAALVMALDSGQQVTCDLTVGT